MGRLRVSGRTVACDKELLVRGQVLDALARVASRPALARAVFSRQTRPQACPRGMGGARVKAPNKHASVPLARGCCTEERRCSGARDTSSRHHRHTSVHELSLTCQAVTCCKKRLSIAAQAGHTTARIPPPRRGDRPPSRTPLASATAGHGAAFSAAQEHVTG